MELPDKGRRLKADFIARRGFWVEEYEGMAALCPDFLEAHLASSVIATQSPRLSPLLSEFIAIAIDVSTTHLFEPGLRLHVRQALALGATPGQIATVIQIVSGIGIQSQIVGLPILAALTGDDGAVEAALSPEQRQLKQEYVDRFHVWSDGHTRLLRASSAYFEAQLRLQTIARAGNHLGEREAALIVVAIHGAVTHLRTDGLALAIQSALASGATSDDVVDVLRRVSSLGMHSCMVGFPILLEELQRHTGRNGADSRPERGPDD